MTSDILTQSQLKEQLHYDPDTGVFMRLIAHAQCVKVGDIAGGLHNMGYIKINVLGNPYLAHRLAILYMTGAFPESEIDHINHNRADNRFINLRPVTHSINHHNISMHSRNTSGFNGVSWDKSRNKWCASIYTNGKHHHLGRFLNLEDAIAARKAANIKYSFHPLHGTTGIQG